MLCYRSEVMHRGKLSRLHDCATQPDVCRPGQMMKAFEEAVADLRVGEMSGPVHTASGVHLILRTL
jgi:ferredoxin-NADP reductase